MGGNGSPALFIALDSFQGSPQQIRHLSLGFPQPVSNMGKFILIHNSSLSGDYLEEMDLRQANREPFPYHKVASSLYRVIQGLLLI